MEARIATLRAAVALFAFATWTLAPFEFQADASISWIVRADDFGGNILATVALGWLLASATRQPKTALLIACGSSVLAEFAQLFIVGREGGPSDVVANTIGGALGIWLYRSSWKVSAPAMVSAVGMWTIAARRSAPGAPTLAVAFLCFGAMLSIPGKQSAPRAAVAVLVVGAVIGLAPTVLVVACISGCLVGALVALIAQRAPWMTRFGAGLIAFAPALLILERWPFDVAGAGDTLVHYEWSLLLALGIVAWLSRTQDVEASQG